MIVLTGDIHHQSLGTGNQAHSPITEVEAARRFLDLCRRYDVKVTFYISGKTFAEQAAEVVPLAVDPLVEVGGHTYACFEPALIHRVWKKLGRGYPGPVAMERSDVRRTVDIIAAHTGRRIQAWRNHMYMGGPNTRRVLLEQGITSLSDQVRVFETPRLASDGLMDVPINVMPDHEHLIHAERTPEWIARWQRRYGFCDAFGSESYSIDEWTRRVLGQLQAHVERGRTATLIIHPITMYLCDGFVSFTKILQFLQKQRSAHVSELVSLAKANTPKAAVVREVTP